MGSRRSGESTWYQGAVATERHSPVKKDNGETSSWKAESNMERTGLGNSVVTANG
jgi:hypothetical protein